MSSVSYRVLFFVLMFMFFITAMLNLEWWIVVIWW